MAILIHHVKIRVIDSPPVMADVSRKEILYKMSNDVKVFFLILAALIGGCLGALAYMHFSIG